MNLSHLVDLETRLHADDAALREGRGESILARDRGIGASVLEDLGVDPAAARGRLEADPAFRRRVASAYVEELRARGGEVLPGAALEGGYRAAGLVLAFFGGLLGIGTAKAVLHWDGRAPVNVFYFIGIFFVLQIALLLLMILAMTVRSFLPGREALSVAARLVRRIGRSRLVERFLGPVRVGTPSLALAARSRLNLYRDVERWMLFALAQRFGLFFNLCAFATCLALVVFTDLAFSWSTTLDRGPEDVHAWFRALSAPWSWAGAPAVPSLDLVTKSRWSKMLKAYEVGTTQAEALAVARQWWIYLVVGLVVWGLLPRFLAWAVGTLRMRRELERVPLDHLACRRLFDRLAPPVLTREAPSPASVGPGAEEAPAASDRAKAGGLFPAAEAPPRGGSPPGAAAPSVSPPPPPMLPSTPSSAEGAAKEPPASSAQKARPNPRPRAPSPGPRVPAKDPRSATFVVLWGRLAAAKDHAARHLASRFGAPVRRVEAAGGPDPDADRVAVEAAADGAARIVVLVEAGVQPTKDLLQVLRGLRDQAGAAVPILVGLVTEDAAAGFVDADPAEAAPFSKRLEALGDPYLGLERLGGAP